MIKQSFQTKAAQTKEVLSLLGDGFSAKTNSAGTMVYGDLKKAAEILGGSFMVSNMAEIYLLVSKN